MMVPDEQSMKTLLFSLQSLQGPCLGTLTCSCEHVGQTGTSMWDLFRQLRPPCDVSMYTALL